MGKWKNRGKSPLEYKPTEKSSPVFAQAITLAWKTPLSICRAYSLFNWKFLLQSSSSMRAALTYLFKTACLPQPRNSQFSQSTQTSNILYKVLIYLITAYYCLLLWDKKKTLENQDSLSYVLLMYVKCLDQCLVSKRCSVNIWCINERIIPTRGIMRIVIFMFSVFKFSIYLPHVLTNIIN